MPVVAGGGPRSSAPWGSTAEGFPRRRGPAAGAPGLERGPGRGRRWEVSGARAPRPSGSVRSGEVALRGGGGPRAGRRGLMPAPERTEVLCGCPPGAPARPSPPRRCLGEGVCVCLKMETLNKCCGNFLHYYSFESNELSLTQPCAQVAVLSLGIYDNVANRLSFPVVCLLEYTRGTSVCGLM